MVQSWKKRRRSRLWLAVAAACLMGAGLSASAPQTVLRWGGDPEGGAPFVEADPRNPSVMRGFDVEIAAAIAQGLGKTAEFVPVSWDAIDQSVRRGDFAIGMSGVEDTPARRARMLETIPYYEFAEVLTVRAADRDRFRTLADLRGRRVGTLGATMAYTLLLSHAATDHVVPVSYDDDVHPYQDLLSGRLDAVVLDNIIAARSMRQVPGLITQPEPLEVGHYVGVLAPGSEALRDRINAVLLARMRDGTIRQILTRWGVWDARQARFEAALLDGSPGEMPSTPLVPIDRGWMATVERYVPALVEAAAVTVLISCGSMALAVILGALIAAGRIYGGRALRPLLVGYVELMRGTPVLLQLFVIYYGFASFIRLPAFWASLIGLGLNYAAYESEIYRGALEAVPRGQLEAARTLGLTEPQVLRLVRGPQAFRLALPPMTNDFVSLLKDSSLVSVLTVVELTKQAQIFAANSGSWLLPGLLCGAFYLVLSLPLAHLARRLEIRWKAPTA
jgi:polar amino acid transport system substrate-binding protein